MQSRRQVPGLAKKKKNSFIELQKVNREKQSRCVPGLIAVFVTALNIAILPHKTFNINLDDMLLRK